MSKTYTTISGMQFVFKGDHYEAEPYSRTFETDDYQAAARFEGDLLKKEMAKIAAQCAERCKLMEEAKYFYYVVVGPAAIDAGILRAAKVMLKLCSQRLGIPWETSIIWIEAEGLKEAEYFRQWKFRDWEYITMDMAIWGKTMNYSNKIWVLKNLSYQETMKIVAHELCHVAQSKEQPMPDREKEAEGFADWAIQEYCRGGISG